MTNTPNKANQAMSDEQRAFVSQLGYYIECSESGLVAIPRHMLVTLHSLLTAQPSQAQAAEAVHTDDMAVDTFARVMKDKLAAARAKGRSGWEHCDPDMLSAMLRSHVEKGDPRDVANFCMMLWHLNAVVSPASQPSIIPGQYLQGYEDGVNAQRAASAQSSQQGAEFKWPPLPELPMQWACSGLEPVFHSHQMQGYANAYGEAVRAALTHATDSDRRDAERYRWLRRRAVMMDYSDEAAITMTLFKEEGPTGEFLDDQIDAALSQKPAPAKPTDMILFCKR